MRGPWTSGAASVAFATADGSALDTLDYVDNTGTLNYAAGQSSASFTVLILDRGLTWGQVALTVALSSPSAGMGVDYMMGAANLTILDDDPPPSPPPPPPPPGNLDYWEAEGATTAAWEVDTNWSLGRAPTVSDTAVFDGDHSDTPCALGVSWVAAPAAVWFDANWASTVTVNGSLTAPSLVIDARDEGGAEIIIGQTGQIEVTNTLTFAGGSISGSGTLLVDGGGTLAVSGTSAADRPTLACPLQVGSVDGTTPGTMRFSGVLQPLVVTGNASINVNARGLLDLASTPLAGSGIASVISNGDAGNETIYNYGDIFSDGAYERVLGVGVENMEQGRIIAGNPLGNGTLHFTGRTVGGTGLVLHDGWLMVNGQMAFDQGALIAGGSVQELNENSRLTFGLTAASPMSVMSGGEMLMRGTLLAHGGFELTGGYLRTMGSQSSKVQVDAGTSFWIAGGVVQVTEVIGDFVSGQLTVDGDLQATGGQMNLEVSTAGGNISRGQLQVNGNVGFGPGFTFFCTDAATNRQGPQTWAPIWWSGTRTGAPTLSLGGLQQGWTYSWNDMSSPYRTLSVFEP